MSCLTLIHIRWCAIVTGVLLLTASCTPTAPPNSTRQDSPKTTTPIIITPVVSEPDPLDGTCWKLVAFESQERTLNIPKQPQPFIQFNRGILGFQTGCNEISGYYVLEDLHITITLSERTVMDCTNSLGTSTMEIEEEFFTAMQTFDFYTIEDDQLRIQYTNGELLFRRVSN